MRAGVLLALAVGLAGCSVANDVADQLARDRAKSVVNGVVADQLPGVDVAPVTDCIIDAASASEILDIAAASATGVTDSTVSKVLTIAQRPDSVDCIAKAALGKFL
ncbi:succinate dehydrogenase [Primorskyibacter sedentarius]|uniref:Succinate dehydrogenase n=1 Tax=Primorskyibacter sedentarius TaxID=745311 RepID=A0A4R3J2J3_9RHOB|nr:succinate dehydrogenase [Primorskyibacter sedentarius]TCS60028.1 hypothetical protein EDD52_11638 [Primorskyibacter sedentarius]